MLLYKGGNPTENNRHDECRWHFLCLWWRLHRKSIFEVQVFISHRLSILYDDDDDDHNDEGEDDHIVGRESIGREIKGAYVFVMLHQAMWGSSAVLSPRKSTLLTRSIVLSITELTALNVQCIEIESILREKRERSGAFLFLWFHYEITN